MLPVFLFRGADFVVFNHSYCQSQLFLFINTRGVRLNINYAKRVFINSLLDAYWRKQGDIIGCEIHKSIW